MTQGQFGFPKRDPTELEERLGVELVKKEHDPFRCHIDKWVKVEGRGSGDVGKYRGMTDKSYLVLLPSLIKVYHPELRNLPEELRFNSYWEDQRPTMIPFDGPSLYPIKRENYDKLVKFQEEVVGLANGNGIIVPTDSEARQIMAEARQHLEQLNSQ
tara:strand:+ start:4596 stop:5066 length:471 start_codon:yes stop_codon:yes gene_type:complete